MVPLQDCEIRIMEKLHPKETVIVATEAVFDKQKCN